MAGADVADGGWRLLVVVAHPDDESFGCGSTIAWAVAAGAHVTVCCATRGEAGSTPEGIGGDLGEVREAELRAAAAVLDVAEVEVLGFGDSGMGGEAGPETLFGAPFEDVVAAVAAVVARARPDVVVTLDETGGDGHRDHVRIALATGQAVADERPDAALYQWCLPRSGMRRWAALVAEQHPEDEHLDADVDEMGRPDEDLTTVLDVAAVEEVRRAAMAEHRSQSSPFEVMPPDLEALFLRTDRLVRLRPPWEGGPVETTLFVPPAGGG